MLINLFCSALQVGPFEEKEVGFASYLGRVSGLQNAFIRIKLQPDCNNLTPPEEKKLIIPLEVEVSDVPGIYASTALLDFGIVRQTDGKKELDLSITNSGKSAKEVVINWIRQTPFKGQHVEMSEFRNKFRSISATQRM